MTNLDSLLKDLGIPEDVKRQIREAAVTDMEKLTAAAKEACKGYIIGMSNDDPYKGGLNYLADVLAAHAALPEWYERGIDMGYTLALGIVTSSPDRTATGCAKEITEEMQRRRMSRQIAAQGE